MLQVVLDTLFESVMAKEQEDLNKVSEQRKFPRTDVNWPGVLESDAGTVECTILNFSVNGAKLKLHGPQAGNNWLGTLTTPRLGTIRANEAWNTPKYPKEIGVTFRASPAAVDQMLAEL
jgi:hypothetical protein